MTQNEVDITKNAVLDMTEAYVDARLSVLDYVKTQIGTIINYIKGQYTKIIPIGNENPHNKNWYEYDKETYTYSLSSDTTVDPDKSYYKYKNDKKYYHNVNCDDGRVIYSNVLSVGNIPFPTGSVVFLIAPNAQFSNQFILGKLDDTPVNITAGSIDIGNGKFSVTSEGVMTAKEGTFEGSIVGGSIDINDGVFTVDENGNMVATSGEIGDFTLGQGDLYAWGITYLKNTTRITTPQKKTFLKELVYFIPSTLGILSNFTITFKYTTLVSASRTAFIQLQYFNGDTWQNLQTETLNNTVDEENEITFNYTFNPNDTVNYRIFLTINLTASTNYAQTIRYSIYTDRVIKTAITTDGYNGKINSSSGTIGGINYSLGRLSSLDNDIYNGFEIDTDSLEIRSNQGDILSEFGNTYFMYSKSYTWASGSDYPVMGLFIRTDDSDPLTALTLYKDSNNLLSLFSDGSYNYYVNGTGHAGTLGESSDRRIKEDIVLLNNEISKELIDKTKTYKFKYKNIEGSHYGMIAQEARELLDELGEQDSKLEYSVGDTNIKNQRNINYQEYIPHLINYVKLQQSQINELKEEISKLKK